MPTSRASRASANDIFKKETRLLTTDFKLAGDSGSFDFDFFVRDAFGYFSLVIPFWIRYSEYF
jgi:hypothetical protein